MGASDYIETTRRVVKCPYCDSTKLAKWGTTTEGNQRYRCAAAACKRTFLDTGALNGHRRTPDMVGSAIRDYYTGKSYKQIAEGLMDEYDLEKEPSKATIYEWVRDYTTKAIKALKDHKAKTGGHWVADEMQVKVGGQKMWLWNVMDSETRYILASHLTPRRDANAARVILRKAAAGADKPPKTITTDKLRSYISAVKGVLPDTKHTQSEGLRADINNNLSERLQGTFRDRIKTLRGMESRKTGQHYLDGWVITYNNFRRHESLRNKTPAHKAKLGAPFEEWADVVKAGAAPRPAVKVTLKPGARPKVKKDLELTLPSQRKSQPRTAARTPTPQIRLPKKRVGPRADAPKPQAKAKPRHPHPMVRLRAGMRQARRRRFTPSRQQRRRR